jgi:hypothetical protein
LALPQNVGIFCGIEHILLYHRAPLRLKQGVGDVCERDISFDNFRNVRRCRLIGRDGDFVGVALMS